MSDSPKSAARQRLDVTIEHLRGKRHCLLITTSNRWRGEGGDVPKSTQLAQRILAALPPGQAEIIDATALNIYPCEGNVSTVKGNNCGVKKCHLRDAEKNPTGNHRCWASFNNPDDELWRVSKALFASDCVVFFGSIRWGQMNQMYQKLIERLTWIENRVSSLGEDSLVKDIDAGIIAVGQNWNGRTVIETQRQVLGFFGFRVVEALCWNWQFTDDPHDETLESYNRAITEFRQAFLEN
ncbi:MAG: hypothetical protein PHT12_03150 [Patescibacteria group bacterium]|nr:hypothetical protein [Patescibacteria group bacterium]